MCCSAAGTRVALTVPIGLVDRPFEQRRDLLVAQLAGAAGNVAVVGGPRSGKSTALRTLVLALAETHDPRDVQVYCLDFGGGSLSSLRALPHVGSVAGRLDVDLIRRTIGQLESLLRAREARRSSGESMAADDPYGDVFLIIDGWATIRQEFDTLEGADHGACGPGAFVRHPRRRRSIAVGRDQACAQGSDRYPYRTAAGRSGGLRDGSQARAPAGPEPTRSGHHP